jgi:hypothetical protein
VNCDGDGDPGSELSPEVSSKVVVVVVSSVGVREGVGSDEDGLFIVESIFGGRN